MSFKVLLNKNQPFLTLNLKKLFILSKPNEPNEILEWYHLYKNGVYGYIFTFVRNHVDAEDILQNVFLALLNLGEKTKKIKYPKSYIFRMARNETMRILKNSNKESVEDSSFFDKQSVNNVDDYINNTEIQTALDKLPLEEREIIIMRVYEQMTFKEIACITNRFLPSITTKYYRAIKKLKLILGENNE